jgi:hypothetical protein
VLKAAGNGSLIAAALLDGPEIPKNLKLVGNYLKIECSMPEGLIFVLKIYYHKNELKTLGIDENSLKIYYWNEEKHEWLPLESVINKDKGYVKAVVDHLTYFALIGESQPDVWQTPIPLWITLVITLILLLTCVAVYITSRKR